MKNDGVSFSIKSNKALVVVLVPLLSSSLDLVDGGHILLHFLGHGLLQRVVEVHDIHEEVILSLKGLCNEIVFLSARGTGVDM